MSLTEGIRQEDPRKPLPFNFVVKQIIEIKERKEEGT
jgi:hypothetical protein